jgi:hypothetical protein
MTTLIIPNPIYIKVVFPLNCGLLPSNLQELCISQNNAAFTNPVVCWNTNSLYPQSSFLCQKPLCFTSPISSTYIYIYIYPPAVFHKLRKISIGTHPSNGLLFQHVPTSCTSYFTSKEKVPNRHCIGICVGPEPVCKLWTETYFLTLPKIVRTSQLSSPLICYWSADYKCSHFIPTHPNPLTASEMCHK